MTRNLTTLLAFLLALSLSPVSYGINPKHPKTNGKSIIKCPSQKRLLKNGIRVCPNTGCGELDPNLNIQKNIVPFNVGPVKKMTVDDMKALPQLEFEIGADRKPLRDLGEGNRVRLVAYALVARRGNPESCNCKLASVADTDNHIVLVDEGALEQFPAFVPPTNKKLTKKQIAKAKLDIVHQREEDSITAEFTPRVRLSHPKLGRPNLQPLIDDAPRDALLVRVTGVLMFDSEHAQPGRRLHRHNDWEIHPVLKMEYCPTGETCAEDSNANWVSIEQ
jgi:hypothetical protein